MHCFVFSKDRIGQGITKHPCFYERSVHSFFLLWCVKTCYWFRDILSIMLRRRGWHWPLCCLGLSIEKISLFVSSSLTVQLSWRYCYRGNCVSLQSMSSSERVTQAWIMFLPFVSIPSRILILLFFQMNKATSVHPLPVKKGVSESFKSTSSYAFPPLIDASSYSGRPPWSALSYSG